MKVKEQLCYYCCSTFDSHSRVFYNERPVPYNECETTLANSQAVYSLLLSINITSGHLSRLYVSM